MVSQRTRLPHAALLGALLLAMLPSLAAAQATGTIRGRVVEGATARPVATAEVSLVGTNRSSVTNAAGEFMLLNVPTGAHTLRVQMFAFAPAEQQVNVTAGQVAAVTFELAARAVTLDEIVVTGTAGATQKRTIGNSITKIDASTVAQTTAITSLTELLQAKSPGMQILTNSGTLGTAADIRIRGAGSLTSTKPVVFIDGVRFSSDSIGTFTPSGAGTTSFSGQTTNAFDFINPNDIESIEIVKGPAAATLYGAEAANGVIQIITKKGKRGEQAVRWDLRSELAQNEWVLDIPDNFTTCTQAFIDERDAAGNPTWPGCQGLAAGAVIRGNPLRDDPLALRTGAVKRVSLSARGGGERYSFYFAGDMNDENGIFRNNFNDRKTLRANFTIHPKDWMDVYVTSSYGRTNLRLPVGDEAAQGMLLSAFRGRPGRVTTNPLNMGWSTTRAEQANAYNNVTRSDRLTLGTTINVAPVSWFRNRLTLGLDYTSSLAQVLSPPGSVDADYAGVLSLGSVAQRVPRNYVYTIDYTGSADRNLTGDLSSTTSFGLQAVSKKYEQIVATGTGLPAPDITLISAAQTATGSNSFSENKSLGVFVQQMFGWKNRLYVTGAVRADDNSSFGSDFDWIYYPKAQVSYVVSEEPLLRGLFEPVRINELKLRGAWGAAGQAPPPFVATQTYTGDKMVRPDGTIGSALRVFSYGNPNLKAERGTELELGFDASLFENRAGVEFTYYRKAMKDVIISVGAPGSSGFGGTFYGSTANVLTNLGETLNSGFEVALTASPVVTPKFAWDINASLATNSNELVEFGDARTELAVSGQSYGAVQLHREGHPLAGYWWWQIKRDASGNPVVFTAANGTRNLVVTDQKQYLGPSVPTREVSLANTFTIFRDLRAFVLFDHKGGHYLFNYKEFNRCAQNFNCERRHTASMLQNPDTVIWRATTSVTEASAAAGSTANIGQPLAYWIEKADFIKLRDVSLTYSLPTRFANQFRASAASITVAGHNLGLWTDYSGLDPEVNGYGNRAFGRADVYPVPMLRRFSVAMNFSF